MTHSVSTVAFSGRPTFAHLSDDIKRVVVLLIKPSHYDSNGFPYRFVRAVLPSNSSAVMYALTNDALSQLLPRDVPFEVHMLEDGIVRHKERLDDLYRRFPEKGTKLIVGFVAVQTAQFPRACDLIDRWQKVGAICVIGGFHVSGSIATMLDGVSNANRQPIPSPHRMPAEIQAVMDKGAIVFHGEAEDTWSSALADIIEGTPKQLYRGGMPDLSRAPLPRYERGYFSDSFVTMMEPFDSSRGCPFDCSFCSIIHVQGRRLRCRQPSTIIEHVKRMCESKGAAAFFLTDDNFARNPRWEEILDGFIALRKQGHKIGFMIQADLACGKIPRFISKLAAAGCTQIFMGVESLDSDNLALVHKRQNKVEDYGALWNQCHKEGVLVHAGYIIGFPNDTPASIARDVQALHDLGADLASFFILTPIPGSEDHARAVAAGIALDPDLNKYDSFHVVMDHPLMSREELLVAYEAAWPQFYSVGNMVTGMKRCNSNPGNQLNQLRNDVWFRDASRSHGTHPMIAGLYPVRDYDDRRPSAPPLSYGRYLFQEAVRKLRYGRRLLVEFYVFQQVVFEVEYASALAKKRHELSGRIHGVHDWLRRTFGGVMTREWLNRFWVDYGRKRWRLLWKPHWHLAMLPHAVTEVVYTLRYVCKLPRLIKKTTVE